MPTTGAKNQPIVQTTDTFNPVADINTLSNWVANNYASAKILTSPTTKSSITGADLFVGLTVYEQVNDLFWYYNGTAWVLLPVAGTPRIDLTRTSNTTSFFTNNSNVTLNTWTTTANRGGFTVASGVVTVPYTGRYNIFYTMAFGSQATASGTRIIRVATSGGPVYWNSTAPVNSQGSYMMLTATGIQLSAGDTLTPTAFQTSGVALDWFASATSPSKFVVEYVGA